MEGNVEEPAAAPVSVVDPAAVEMTTDEVPDPGPTAPLLDHMQHGQANEHPLDGQPAGYPPQQGGYPQPQGGYPQPQGGYPQPQEGYPQPQGGYPQTQEGYPQPQGGYPEPNQQQQTAQAPAWQPDAAGAPFKWDGVSGAGTECPPPNSFSPVGGYEQVNPDAFISPPPFQPPPVESKPEEIFTSSEALTEDEVREALSDFVSQNCCYGSKPAQEMEFQSIKPSNALHYILETFTESRTTRRQHEPFRGGFVDGPQCGMAPGPWDLQCPPKAQFDTHTKHLEVPHTSDIKMCFRCTGRGFLRCTTCHGDGRNKCTRCSGSGTVSVPNEGEEGGNHDESCSTCSGSGQTRCSKCGGDGRITCHECKGLRSLRHFLQLVVTYTNNKDDFILEQTEMPDELIRDVSGKVIFEQTLPYLWPISCYPVAQINENSVRMVNEHTGKWMDQRKLQQRQVLRSVPVSEVDSTWNDESKRFWVYGFEHKVHFPDYPQQCCCGCNIL